MIAVGGADMTTKIYALGRYENLFTYTLGSHTDSIVGCFFEENSLNVSFYEWFATLLKLNIYFTFC